MYLTINFRMALDRNVSSREVYISKQHLQRQPGEIWVSLLVFFLGFWNIMGFKWKSKAGVAMPGKTKTLPCK